MNIFSFDIDWAPDEVIKDVVDLLNGYKIKGTFFATHQSELLKRLEAEGQHEIGIHPNFNHLLNGKTGNFKSVIDELLAMYPSAIGMRGHSLAHSCPILLYGQEKGIKYDSNIYMPYSRHIRPFDYFGIKRIPYNWEDDGHWISEKSFGDCGLNLYEDTNIFDFHPVHIYLNTCDQNMYESAKEFYQEPQNLLKNRNDKVAGTRDLFISLLELSLEKNMEVKTLKTYYEDLVKDEIRSADNV